MPDKETLLTKETLLIFDNVTLGYGSHTILTNLNFALSKGDYIGIVGPNGSGKTTLLHAILGSLKAQKGEITRHKEDLAFGYVPQVQTMDDHFPLTVLDIVLMGRYKNIGLLRRPRKEDKDKAHHALEQVKIPDLTDRLFRELSGGQKQRTLMARALVCDPDVLVLDEPTNDMDVAAEHATMELIDQLQSEKGLLVLMVSHLLNVVVNHVHHVAIVGDGKMTVGPINEVVNAEMLQSLYGIPLNVVEVGTKRVIL
jgi:ABC-type Mn2+/Zn2+ transport system ATPase subunit